MKVMRMHNRLTREKRGVSKAAVHDRNVDLAAQLETEKARRAWAEERERETRHAFTISQEALRTLETKYEMTAQDHQLLTSQAAKVCVYNCVCMYVSVCIYVFIPDEI